MAAFAAVLAGLQHTLGGDRLLLGCDAWLVHICSQTDSVTCSCNAGSWPWPIDFGLHLLQGPVCNVQHLKGHALAVTVSAIAGQRHALVSIY